ncbi:PEGA domain-containing protein [Salinispira pacifica]
MWRRARVALYTFLVFTAAGQPLIYAADAAETVPVDTRKEWTIGFSEFDTSGLSSDFAYLASSIPQLLAGNLQAVGDHTLSSSEKSARARSVLQDALFAAGKSLSDLVKQRDQLLFSTADSVTLPKQYRDVDAQIEAARRRLSFLQGVDPASIEIEGVKPVVFWSGMQEGKLLPAAGARPAALADANSLQMLVYGSITVQAGLAYLDVYGYDAVLDRVDYHKSYAGRPEQLYDWVEFATEELSGYLLGRDWANLAVRTAPASAAIEVDGTLVGYGTADLKYIKPGRHTVTAAEAGYARQEREVDLPAAKTTSITIPLGSPAGGSSSIKSTPSDADVYVGSIWVGKTPVTVPLPIQPEEVRISKKGYLDSHFLLSPEGPESVDRVLMSAAIDWSKEIETRRDRFYTHLGWFLLSVPVPVILNGLYQNELVAASSPDFASLSPQTQHRVIVTGNALYYAAWGTAFLSGGLLVNAIISLVDYIRAGQSFHVR